jgi:hypothetical protein
MTHDSHYAERIDELVRKAGQERAFYLGQLIGDALNAAWDGICAFGASLRREHTTAAH